MRPVRLLLALAFGALAAACGPRGPAAAQPTPPAATTASIPAAAAAGPFADWAAVIVAGDFKAAHTDKPTETFDNARRDLAKAFAVGGFAPANIRQFSTRPERYTGLKPPQPVAKAEQAAIFTVLRETAAKAQGGCLFYVTSHGSPAGAVLGEGVLKPVDTARALKAACGERPTVVVISACFSGVFVPELAGPNRLVLTAARGDRSSFGCGEADTYPYFDACVLESLPKAANFLALSEAARACVAAREKAEKLTPASEPQVSVGKAVRPMLPLYAFAKPSG